MNLMAIKGDDPAVPRHRLKGKLRDAREGSDLTREQAAAELDWSLSKLVRIETGDQGISRTDLLAMLQLYQVTDEGTVKELTELARRSRGQQWWSSYREVVSLPYGQLLGYEGSASRIRALQPLLVPGLLHTADYAVELRKAYMPEEKARKLMRLLVKRQERLFGQPEPPEMTFVFGEEALTRSIGGETVMRGQLRHLLEVAELPFVSMQIVPFSAGAHPGLIGSYILLGLRGSNEGVLFIEGPGGDFANRGNQQMIASFSGLFDTVQSRALSPDRTRTLIERKVDQLSQVERESSDKSMTGERHSQGA
jgi:transcriptional regulator with XRE-family HTH domain